MLILHKKQGDKLERVKTSFMLTSYPFLTKMMPGKETDRTLP